MTKEKDEVMIYSDDWTDYDDAEVEEECPNKSDDEYSFFINARWSDMSCELDGFNKKHPAFVGQGYFQGWQGNEYGGLVCDDIHTMVQKFAVQSSCSYTSFYKKKDEMVVYNAHHDGTSRLEIRALTERGYKWYQKHLDTDRKTVIEHLWNTKGLTVRLYGRAG